MKSNWSCNFGEAETGSGAKKRVVLRREVFHSEAECEIILKQSEKRVYEQKFAFSLAFLFVHMRQFRFDFFQFFGLDFFCKWFFRSMNSYSRPIFCLKPVSISR